MFDELFFVSLCVCHINCVNLQKETPQEGFARIEQTIRMMNAINDMGGTAAPQQQVEIMAPVGSYESLSAAE